jgi:hypothetical protein
MPQKRGSESGGTQEITSHSKRARNTRGTKHSSQGEVGDMPSQSSSKATSVKNKYTKNKRDTVKTRSPRLKVSAKKKKTSCSM